MTETTEPTSTRLMNALQSAHAGGRLVYMGGPQYAVRVDRTDRRGTAEVVRSGSTEQMWSWLNGFTRGAQLPGDDGWWETGGPQQATDRLLRARQDVHEFRKIVLDPSLADAMRCQVLAAMEARELNFTELAEKIGRGPQSVRDALLFGNPNPRIGTLGLFDLMLRAMRWPVTIVRRPFDADADVLDMLSGSRVEPAGITRMRALVIAVECRLVDRVAPGGLQKARRTREFVVQTGGHELTRQRETLVHWLRGLADGAGHTPGMRALNLE